MSQVKTIFKNMSWLFVSQIVASICGFIWTILTARYLGVSDYGILGFAVSFSGIFGNLLDLGISTSIVRHIATDYDSAPKFVGNAIPLKILFALLTFLLTLLGLILMGSSTVTIIITLLFTVELAFKSQIGLLNGTFQAFEKGKYQGIGAIIMNTLTLVFILISVVMDYGLFGIGMAYVLGSLIPFIYEYIVLNKHIANLNFEFDYSFWKDITLSSLPFAATSMLFSIYYSIDVVMLTNLVGDYASGIYNASYKLVFVLTLFYGIYSAVIFPVMNKFYKNNKRLLVVSYEKSIKYLMLVMIPLAVATTFYSLDVIQLIYGHEFDAASSVLSILIWTVCLLFVSSPGNNFLNASHKELTVTKIYSIIVVFNIVLNFIMIPYLSYDGAAITTVLSDILIVAMQSYVIYKMGHRINKKLYLDLGKIIIGSLVLGAALTILNLNMWVAIPVGILIYLIAIILLRLFDDDDKYVIREILGKN